ncbi:MAG TPA: nuclear transport factor 2 family protein [Kofleriaceae bacterium]|jgi:ketosteroid isomerase-like protein
MTTLEIGRRLVELCKQGKNVEAIQELYADDAASAEPFGDEVRGRDALLARLAAIRGGLTIHQATCEGPYPHHDRFVVHFTRDATMHATGVRSTIDEMGVYTVAGGKIARSEFFYVTQ